MRHRSPVFLLFCLIAFFSVRAASAGPLGGRLVDPNGRAVVGARVLLVSGSTIVASATSDRAGTFSIDAPDTGRFEIRVAADGLRAKPSTVDVAQTKDAGTIALEVSAVSDSVVVSAAQVEIPLSSAAASVTILTGDELAAHQTESVADALRLVPGLTVTANGGRGALTSVFPRGGESDYSLVFVDGVETNAFGGGFDFAHLPIANVDRIEVVRGPQSALYGSNAIGSVVRIVTRQGGAPVGSASVEGGGFGTARIAAGASGGKDAWQWGASAEQLSSDGMNGELTATGQEISNDDYARHSAGGSLAWQRTPGGGRIRGDVTYGHDERGNPGPFGSDPGGTYGGIDTVSRGTNANWTTSISAAIPVSSRVRTSGLFSYGDFDSAFASAFGDSVASSRRTTARGQADITLLSNLDLSAGGELLWEQAKSTYITAPGNTLAPVDRSVAAGFAEARWNAAARLSITGGVRVDRIVRSRLASNPEDFSPRADLPADTVVSANPKVSAAWFARSDAGSYTKVRGAAGSGIKPPTAFEIAFTDNPSLKPERSQSAEIGVDQAFAGGRALIEATAFVNDYDDLIVAVGSFTGSSRYRTDNIANARASGLELSGTTRTRAGAHAELLLRVGYTFLDTEVLAVDRATSAPPPFTVGDPLLRRPSHQFSLDALVTGGRATGYFQGGARSRVLDVDPSYGTFGGLFYAPGFNVWNAGASVRIHPSVEVFGRIDNLFDRSYEEALGFPALGRSALAGVRIAPGR